jgi:uncharacterized protein YjaZ
MVKKQKIKKWVLRLTTTVLFIAGLLLTIILHPILMYANTTTHGNYTIFHNKPLEPAVLTSIDTATEFLKASELYNPKLHLDICLNDDSKYPQLIRSVKGAAFAWGFYDKVVMHGSANFSNNYVELNGYKWNVTQLLAHEMTHCLQFDNLGLWKSKPIANIPNWKWEGYAEYVSRQRADQKNLFNNVKRLAETDENKWEIKFADGTMSPRQYYDNWILIQYCMDVKKMTYKQILADTTNEKIIRQEMMDWFGRCRHTYGD